MRVSERATERLNVTSGALERQRCSIRSPWHLPPRRGRLGHRCSAVPSTAPARSRLTFVRRVVCFITVVVVVVVFSWPEPLATPWWRLGSSPGGSTCDRLTSATSVAGDVPELLPGCLACLDLLLIGCICCRVSSGSTAGSALFV